MEVVDYAELEDKDGLVPVLICDVSIGVSILGAKVLRARDGSLSVEIPDVDEMVRRIRAEIVKSYELGKRQETMQ